MVNHIFFELLIKWSLFKNLNYPIEMNHSVKFCRCESGSADNCREEIFQLKTDGRGAGEIRGTLHSLNTYPLINFENK